MAKNTAKVSHKSSVSGKLVSEHYAIKHPATIEVRSRKRSILSPVIKGSRTPEQFRAAAETSRERSTTKR
jgi:hypothetical protein